LKLRMVGFMVLVIQEGLIRTQKVYKNA